MKNLLNKITNIEITQGLLLKQIFINNVFFKNDINSSKFI